MGDKMLAERLKKLRKEKSLSQKVFAGIMKLSPSTIAMYETSQRDPDTTTLQNIADFFEVSVDYLLGRTDVRNLYTVDEHNTEFNELIHEYKTPKQKELEDKKLYIFDMILQTLIDDGTLKEEFEINDETEKLILKRVEKIVKMYHFIYNRVGGR